MCIRDSNYVQLNRGPIKTFKDESNMVCHKYPTSFIKCYLHKSVVSMKVKNNQWLDDTLFISCCGTRVQRLVHVVLVWHADLAVPSGRRSREPLLIRSGADVHAWAGVLV